MSLLRYLLRYTALPCTRVGEMHVSSLLGFPYYFLARNRGVRLREYISSPFVMDSIPRQFSYAEEYSPMRIVHVAKDGFSDRKREETGFDRDEESGKFRSVESGKKRGNATGPFDARVVLGAPLFEAFYSPAYLTSLYISIPVSSSPYPP